MISIKDKKEYDNFLREVVLKPLLRMIAIKHPENPAEAVVKFYRSPLYDALLKKDTKYWQYSTNKLFTMFVDRKYRWISLNYTSKSKSVLAE